MASGFESIGPLGFGWDVTPSDTVALVMETRAIYVGVGGDIVIRQFDPTTNKLGNRTYKSVPTGTVLPVKTTLILATGTTATNIIAGA